MEAYIKAHTTINAPIEKVWNALVNPDMTPKYMFGCRVVTDWQPGSRVDWVGTHEGKDVTFVTGECIVFEPNSKLVYSVIDPFASYPKTPENHLIVTMTLTEENGQTHLSASQGDYTTVADGEKRYGHGPDVWSTLLKAIKELLEKEG